MSARYSSSMFSSVHTVSVAGTPSCLALLKKAKELTSSGSRPPSSHAEYVPSGMQVSRTMFGTWVANMPTDGYEESPTGILVPIGTVPQQSLFNDNWISDRIMTGNPLDNLKSAIHKMLAEDYASNYARIMAEERLLSSIRSKDKEDLKRNIRITDVY